MQGRRLRKTGSVFAGREVFVAENEADAGTSFAAVERSMSDRLLGLFLPAVPERQHQQHQQEHQGKAEQPEVRDADVRGFERPKEIQRYNDESQ